MNHNFNETNLFVNGRLAFYGCDFDDIPYCALQIKNGTIDLNLMSGDIFKISTAFWRKSFGYESLSNSQYFSSENDGFCGRNIHCDCTGHYRICITNDTISITRLGEVIPQSSMWQIAGSFNEWSRDENKNFLTLTNQTFENFPSSSWTTYASEPLYLYEGDQFKAAILRDDGSWKCGAGYSQLANPLGNAKSEDFIPGDSLGGANCKVATSGKYTIYIHVDKNLLTIRVSWMR